MPSISQEPSPRCTADSSCRSVRSSGSSPAMAVRMSVGVTMPSSTPYSSTTTAMWTGFSRNISSMPEHRRRLVHDERIAQRRDHVEAPGARHLVEQVLGVDDALDLVEALPARRIARMAAFGDLLADGLGRVVEVDPVHFDTRRHHAPDRAVGKAQHALDHVALGHVEHAGLRALRDHALHLLLRHRALALLRDAQEAGKRPGGNAEEPHDGGAGDGEPRHDRGNGGGDALGIVEGDALWHQLADDEREIGDGDHDQGERDGIGVGAERLLPHQAQRLGQRGAGKGAGEDADQSDADLHGGEKTRRLFEQLQRRARAGHVLVRHLLQPGATRRHDGQLRHGEEAVQHNQKGNDEKLPADHRIRLSLRLAARWQGPVRLPARHDRDKIPASKQLWCCPRACRGPDCAPSGVIWIDTLAS